MNLTRNRVHPTEERIDQIAYFLTRNVERRFNRKSRRIFSKPDQLLIVYSERPDRRRFTQPIGLRVNHVRWQRRPEILGKKLIASEWRVDAQGFTGNRSMDTDQFDRYG